MGRNRMSLIRRLLTSLRPPRARYEDEVLFAGWVQLPASFRARNQSARDL
jgi:hypothetical protein